MKKLLFLTLFVAIMSFSRLFSQTPTRVDVSGGDFPTHFYAPNGDLYIFYTIAGAPEKMVMRKRNFGDINFGNEIDIYNSKRVAAMHFAQNGDIDLALSGSNSVAILQSTNSGSTWNYVTSYGAADGGADPCYMPLYFTEDADSLRLVYGYMAYNAVLGSYPTVYTAKRKSNVWDVNSTQIKDGTYYGGFIAGVVENGNTVSIITDRGHLYSTDNGVTYVMQDKNDPTSDNLRARGMYLYNNKMHIIRSFTYGPVGSDQNLNYTNSTDFGATWMTPQKSIFKNGITRSYPCIAVVPDFIVAAWLVDYVSNPPTGYKKINCTAAYLTNTNIWDAEGPLVELEINQRISDNNNVMLDAKSFSNTFSLIYSVRNGDGTFNIYLLQWTLGTTEVNNAISNSDFRIFPNPACNQICVETIENHINGSVYITNINGQELIRQQIKDSKTQINISNLPSGIYFVKLVTDKTVEVRKIIKV
ncbi:MAG: T9SS type A sorting domain-containing protein [Bacteroidales bacterium]|nr:T9SS type A sorting domain-containing protein [Bacteroidales bacterium]